MTILNNFCASPKFSYWPASARKFVNVFVIDLCCWLFYELNMYSDQAVISGLIKSYWSHLTIFIVFVIKFSWNSYTRRTARGVDIEISYYLKFAPHRSICYVKTLKNNNAHCWSTKSQRFVERNHNIIMQKWITFSVWISNWWPDWNYFGSWRCISGYFEGDCTLRRCLCQGFQKEVPWWSKQVLWRQEEDGA